MADAALKGPDIGVGQDVALEVFLPRELLSAVGAIHDDGLVRVTKLLGQTEREGGSTTITS
jgi:hypothetical protein